MFQAARLVGETLREVIQTQSGDNGHSAEAFTATLILGGQVRGGDQRLFLIYPEGNFIEASEDTPFFQIGETKYGRPILVRAFEPEMSFEEAIKLLLVSFDSTIKANLSVSLPLDLHAYTTGTLARGKVMRVQADNAYFDEISTGWGVALKNAFRELPDFTFPDA